MEDRRDLVAPAEGRTPVSPQEQAFFRLYGPLPRHGPGSDACTREALARLPALPPQPAVADLGCGRGRSSLVLAADLGARVIAIDRHAPFLARLRADARKQGLEGRIETREGDMAAPPLAPGTLDLIWSEGAIYHLGFENGLRLWRPLLRPQGLVALSEVSWLGAARPAAAFWAEAYPGMGSIEDNTARAAAADFALLDHFTLPPSAWWDEYYRPLQARIERLRPGADAVLEAVIAEAEAEIELFARHGDSYGYVFYLLRRAGGNVEPGP
jgi:SAM-dependent methyltransferase